MSKMFNLGCEAPCNSEYGNYRTKKFTDFYPKAQDFINDYHLCGIPATITDDSATTLFYLLYARYGNSHIINSDENQFKYKLFSVVFQYGPTWEKRLDIQMKLRNLTDDELMRGTKAIYNRADNPGTTPSTGSLEEVEYINAQNTTGYKKSKIDAYADLLSLLETDVTEGFIKKFDSLFITILEPREPLYYATEIGDDNYGI